MLKAGTTVAHWDERKADRKAVMMAALTELRKAASRAGNLVGC